MYISWVHLLCLQTMDNGHHGRDKPNNVFLHTVYLNRWCAKCEKRCYLGYRAIAAWLAGIFYTILIAHRYLLAVLV